MTILALVCDPPNTLIFADQRYEATLDGVTFRSEESGGEVLSKDRLRRLTPL
jgi:hypothetical protein